MRIFTGAAVFLASMIFCPSPGLADQELSEAGQQNVDGFKAKANEWLDQLSLEFSKRKYSEPSVIPKLREVLAGIPAWKSADAGQTRSEILPSHLPKSADNLYDEYGDPLPRSRFRAYVITDPSRATYFNPQLQTFFLHDSKEAKDLQVVRKLLWQFLNLSDTEIKTRILETTHEMVEDLRGWLLSHPVAAFPFEEVVQKAEGISNGRVSFHIVDGPISVQGQSKDLKNYFPDQRLEFSRPSGAALFQSNNRSLLKALLLHEILALTGRELDHYPSSSVFLLYLLQKESLITGILKSNSLKQESILESRANNPISALPVGTVVRFQGLFPSMLPCWIKSVYSRGIKLELGENPHLGETACGIESRLLSCGNPAGIPDQSVFSVSSPPSPVWNHASSTLWSFQAYSEELKWQISLYCFKDSSDGKTVVPPLIGDLLDAFGNNIQFI